MESHKEYTGKLINPKVFYLSFEMFTKVVL